MRLANNGEAHRHSALAVRDQSTTDAEIARGNVFHSRKLIKVAISRRRRDFAGPYKFNDRNAETIAGSFPMEVAESKESKL